MAGLPKPPLPARPSVAVVVPCRNEARRIRQCLDSLLADPMDRERLEILVVDGRSEDGTREIVEEYCRRTPCVRLLDNPAGDKPSALNLAVQSTDADVIVRADAHARYPAGYLSACLRRLAQSGADNVGGVRETEAGETTWEAAVAVAVSHPFAAGNAAYRTGRVRRVRPVDTVFGGCYRREVFERIGLFHPALRRTQDRELNARLRAAGGLILLDPAIRCSYFPRTNVLSYVRWVFAGGYWVYYADRFVDTRIRSWRNAAPLWFMLWQAAAAAGGLLGWPGASWLWAPVAAYWFAAAAVACLAAGAQRRPSLAPALLFLFPATHYAYGAGGCLGWLAARCGRRRKSPPPALRPRAARAA